MRAIDNPKIMYLIPLDGIRRERKIIMRGSLVTISTCFDWEGLRKNTIGDIVRHNWKEE